MCAYMRARLFRIQRAVLALPAAYRAGRETRLKSAIQ